MSKDDAIEKAIFEAFLSWLNDHPISVPSIIEDAVKHAVLQWLDAHKDAILIKPFGTPSPPSPPPERQPHLLGASLKFLGSRRRTRP